MINLDEIKKRVTSGELQSFYDFKWTTDTILQLVAEIERFNKGLPFKVGDYAECLKPMEGFTTAGKKYEIIGLRPEENRIVIMDDRGKECWTSVNRYWIRNK